MKKRYTILKVDKNKADVIREILEEFIVSESSASGELFTEWSFEIEIDDDGGDVDPDTAFFYLSMAVAQELFVGLKQS